ncbi:MAG: CoA transferase [Dehalococcoidia bacterium]
MSEPSTIYRLPLAAYRVLDLGPGAAARYAARLLGDAGAEVIAVERAVTPRSDAFRQLNRDKLGCVLDFAMPRGAELVRRLAALCDVVIEGFDEAERERFGFGYEALRALRPDVIVTSVAGASADGASATFAGIAAGTAAAAAVCVALLHLRDTGEGQHVAVDAAACAPAFAAPLPSRSQILVDSRLRERRFFEPVSHLEGGVIEMPALLWRLGMTPCHVRLPAPEPGQHNRYVFASLLGLSEEEIAELEAKGIVVGGWSG